MIALVRRFASAMLAVTLCGAVAHGDGGTVRLVERSRPFAVTVFTSPEPLRAGPADVSVLVQRHNGTPVLDAAVAVELTPPDGTAPPFTVAATHEAATNKLLYAAPLVLSASGLWRVEVVVHDGTDSVSAGCDLAVAPPPPQLLAVWPYLALPPVAVALFALNQRLRRARVRDFASL